MKQKECGGKADHQMLRPTSTRIVAPVLVVFTLAACSVDGGEQDATVTDLPYIQSASKVAWTWATPDEVERKAIYPVPGGIAVLISGGVVALSGDNGEPMWEYREPASLAKDAFGTVSDDGQHFVLQIDRTDQSDSRQMVIIDTETGDVVHEFQVQKDSPFAQSSEGQFTSVTDRYWLTVDTDSSEGGGTVSAYKVGTDERIWTAKELVDCKDSASVDSVLSADGTVIVAATCFAPQATDEQDDGDMVVGQDFTSTLVGLSADSGEEIWRTDSDTGVFASDSHDRQMSLLENGLASIYYPWSDTGQIVDPHTGELTTLEEGSALWADDEASLFNVWDERTRNYWQQDLSGDITKSIDGFERIPADDYQETASRRDARVAGLSEGVVIAAEEVSADEGDQRIALFRGFDGEKSIDFDWEGDQELRLTEARSAPGAVVISYSSGYKESGVIALQ